VEIVSQLRPNEQETLRRWGDLPLLLVLPGSRSSEINRLLDIFAKTVDAVQKAFGPIEVVIPTVPHLVDRLRKETSRWISQPRIVVDAGEKHAAFRRARAALVKSGTVTLELAVAIAHFLATVVTKNGALTFSPITASISSVLRPSCTSAR